MYGVEIYATVRQLVLLQGKSRREVARQLGISRDSVSKMCRYSAPPGYVRTKPVERPKIGALPVRGPGVAGFEDGVGREGEPLVLGMAGRRRREHACREDDSERKAKTTHGGCQLGEVVTSISRFP